MRTSARFRVTVATAAVVAAGTVALTGPVLAATGQSAGRNAPSLELPAGQAGSRASVPWSKVGPGWVLALYSASTGGPGVKPRAGGTTLYLVDPAGGRYALASWPARSAEANWRLVAWSGDGKRALFAGPKMYQLTLATGRVTSFMLPRGVTAIGYTRPDGLNILTQRVVSAGRDGKLTLQRYNLRGRLQRTLAAVAGLGEVAYQPKGQELAAGAVHGLALVSNSGGVLRNLPVPGAKYGCNAVRWWSSSMILANCLTPTQLTPRLWLVPVSGARPRALTPARVGGGFDFGDFSAWQLRSGLYVNGEGACGTEVIGKQAANGKETFVAVPGSASSVIITATKSQLLVQRTGGCEPGLSLAWFNPVSRAITVAVPVRCHQIGVIAAVPYFVVGRF